MLFMSVLHIAISAWLAVSVQAAWYNMFTSFLPGSSKSHQLVHKEIPVPPIPVKSPFRNTKASSDAILRHRKLYTIMTIGSQGDVQPYIALCLGIIHRLGHRCRIATHKTYETWIKDYGVEFGELYGDPKDLMQLMTRHPDGAMSFAFLRDALTQHVSFIARLLESSVKATRDTDILIDTPPCFAGPHLATMMTRDRARLGKPPVAYFRTMPFPWTSTGVFPHPMVPEQDSLVEQFFFPHRLFRSQPQANLASYRKMLRSMNAAAFILVNKWRMQKLGLPPTVSGVTRTDLVPFLYSFSEHVVPRPNDWQPWVHLCGYWFLDPLPTQPIDEHPQALVDFLKADPSRTIYVGFGSVPVPDPVQATQEIIQAATQAGIRLVFALGWSMPDERNVEFGPDPRPNHVYIVKSVPHSWLFPKVSAVIHHGVCPFLLVQ